MPLYILIMIALPIISIVSCIAFIVFVLFRYGVPVSISESYYLLPNKWDWLFAAWTILTSVPFGIYWWQVAPAGLKWIPITVMIALLLVGASCCYKSGPKSFEGYRPDIAKGNPEKSTHGGLKFYKDVPWWKSIAEYIKNEYNPKNFFKYGPARLIHYANSLIAIILSTVYICMTCGHQAVAGTVISYAVWLLVGMKVDGVYNPDYSMDVDNKAWVFFMEIVCFIQLFVFIW